MMTSQPFLMDKFIYILLWQQRKYIKFLLKQNIKDKKFKIMFTLASNNYKKVLLSNDYLMHKIQVKCWAFSVIKKSIDKASKHADWKTLKIALKQSILFKQS